MNDISVKTSRQISENPQSETRPHSSPDPSCGRKISLQVQFHRCGNLFPVYGRGLSDGNRHGVGGGYVPLFLPLWAQKSCGPWTTYGGGGYWINPGAGNNNFWQLGWLGQREITKVLTLGAEIFYFGKDTDDGRDRTGYNIGGIFNLSEDHHILFSAGSDIVGDNRFSAYLGYQWTFGTHEEDKK